MQDYQPYLCTPALADMVKFHIVLNDIAVFAPIGEEPHTKQVYACSSSLGPEVYLFTVFHYALRLWLLSNHRLLQRAVGDPVQQLSFDDVLQRVHDPNAPRTLPREDSATPSLLMLLDDSDMPIPSDLDTAPLVSMYAKTPTVERAQTLTLGAFVAVETALLLRHKHFPYLQLPDSVASLLTCSRFAVMPIRPSSLLPALHAHYGADACAWTPEQDERKQQTVMPADDHPLGLEFRYPTYTFVDEYDHSHVMHLYRNARNDRLVNPALRAPWLWGHLQWASIADLIRFPPDELAGLAQSTEAVFWSLHAPFLPRPMVQTDTVASRLRQLEDSRLHRSALELMRDTLLPRPSMQALAFIQRAHSSEIGQAEYLSCPFSASLLVATAAHGEVKLMSVESVFSQSFTSYIDPVCHLWPLLQTYQLLRPDSLAPPPEVRYYNSEEEYLERKYAGERDIDFRLLPFTPDYQSALNITGFDGISKYHGPLLGSDEWQTLHVSEQTWPLAAQEDLSVLTEQLVMDTSPHVSNYVLTAGSSPTLYINQSAVSRLTVQSHDRSRPFFPFDNRTLAAVLADESDLNLYLVLLACQSANLPYSALISSETVAIVHTWRYFLRTHPREDFRSLVRASISPMSLQWPLVLAALDDFGKQMDRDHYLATKATQDNILQMNETVSPGCRYAHQAKMSHVSAYTGIISKRRDGAGNANYIIGPTGRHHRYPIRPRVRSTRPWLLRKLDGIDALQYPAPSRRDGHMFNSFMAIPPREDMGEDKEDKEDFDQAGADAPADAQRHAHEEAAFEARLNRYDLADCLRGSWLHVTVFHKRRSADNSPALLLLLPEYSLRVNVDKQSTAELTGANTKAEERRQREEDARLKAHKQVSQQQGGKGRGVKLEAPPEVKFMHREVALFDNMNMASSQAPMIPELYKAMLGEEMDIRALVQITPLNTTKFHKLVQQQHKKKVADHFSIPINVCLDDGSTCEYIVQVPKPARDPRSVELRDNAFVALIHLLINLDLVQGLYKHSEFDTLGRLQIRADGGFSAANRRLASRLAQACKDLNVGVSAVNGSGLSHSSSESTLFSHFALVLPCFHSMRSPYVEDRVLVPIPYVSMYFSSVVSVFMSQLAQVQRLRSLHIHNTTHTRRIVSMPESLAASLATLRETLSSIGEGLEEKQPEFSVEGALHWVQTNLEQRTFTDTIYLSCVQSLVLEIANRFVLHQQTKDVIIRLLGQLQTTQSQLLPSFYAQVVRK